MWNAHTLIRAHTHAYVVISSSQWSDKSPEYCELCVGSQSGKSDFCPGSNPSTHPAPLRVPSVHIYVLVCVCVCGCKQAKEHANISFARWQVNTEVAGSQPGGGGQVGSVEPSGIGQK